MKDNTVCRLDLSMVDKNGIKINHPFKALDVGDGQTTRAVIDFDVRESVTLDNRLKPVIKLKDSKRERSGPPRPTWDR